MHRMLTALGRRILGGLAAASVLTAVLVAFVNPVGQAAANVPSTARTVAIETRAQMHAARMRAVSIREASRIAMRVVPPMRSWKISAEFGDFNARWWNRHTGLDLRAKYGTRVKAVAEGKVIKTTYDRFYGRVVVVRGHGYDVWYGHLSSIAVKVGAKLKPGNAIGRVGSSGHVTGPHLHIEVRRHDFPSNPKPFLWGPRMGHVDPIPAWARQRITHLSDL